jgi:hypothetical protein
MNESEEQLLAARIDRELRALPVLAAPNTLAPRVLTTLAARLHAPWWRKSWAGWPPGIRLAFLAVSLAVAGLLVIVGLQLPALAGLFGDSLHNVSGWIARAQQLVDPVWRIVDALWSGLQAAPPLLLWSVTALIGLAYALCVGLGTFGYRVAVNRI